MQTPLEIIAGYGAPTHSYIEAVTYMLHERRRLSKDEAESEIAKILAIDTSPSYSNEKEANVYFHYLIQETIRTYMSGVIPEMSDVWEEVNRRAAKFLQDCPWAIKEYADSEEVTDADGTVRPKQKKGAKKEQSKALYKELNDGTNDRNVIIQAFMDDLGMSKAGATTYFHNLKKKYGYAGPKVEKKKRKRKVLPHVKPPTHKAIAKKKGPSKGQIAQEIYAKMIGSEKADVIAAIVDATGTSPAGANTYYCAAKKAHG